MYNLKQQERNSSIISFGANECSNNEQTLNKEGKVPSKPKAINPKDLSNEELEYIIKTGSLPPRLN